MEFKCAITTKTLRIMKLMVALLFFVVMQTSAKSWSQTVTLHLTDAPLEKVFGEIRRQTGYNFLYNDDWLKDSKKVTIALEKAKLDDVLDACFEGQPFTYAIIEHTIALKLLPPPPAVPVQPPIDVHGRVTDSLGRPLAGASVIVK